MEYRMDKSSQIICKYYIIIRRYTIIYFTISSNTEYTSQLF